MKIVGILEVLLGNSFYNRNRGKIFVPLTQISLQFILYVPVT